MGDVFVGLIRQRKSEIEVERVKVKSRILQYGAGLVRDRSPTPRSLGEFLWYAQVGMGESSAISGESRG
jgi:hypothetical protein